MEIQWDEKLSLGIEPLDDDHRQLLAIVNDMLKIDPPNDIKAPTLKVLERLHEYAASHFQREEALLERHGYPELPQHRQIHADLIRQLQKIQTDLQNAIKITMTVPLVMETHKLLRNWLFGHIAQEDHKYAAFLKGRA
ncbi:MAG: hemerythrin family protein [Magnetococcales bacterium]|nr:hemerythrin family protein [Magnetococcales bacterium]